MAQIKLNFSSTKSAELNSPRPPVREFPEIVEMLGVLPGQLRHLMNRSPIPFPEPQITKGKRKWYRKDAVLDWWGMVGGREAAVSPRFEYAQDYRKRRQGETGCKSLLTH